MSYLRIFRQLGNRQIHHEDSFVAKRNSLYKNLTDFKIIV